MKTITLEEHFTTPEYLEAVAKTGFQEHTNRHMQAVQRKLADLGDERIADMDAAGVDVQVLSLAGTQMDLLDSAVASAVARASNDRVAQAVRDHPTRFAAFAALALQEPDQAAEELRRCVRELNFQGALVGGTTGGLFLDDSRFTPLFEAAQELKTPIYLHPAPPPQAVREAYYGGLPDGVGAMLSMAAWGWHVETGLHVLRLIAGGVFDRFPELQMIIGHMGENLPFSIARAESVLSRTTLNLERPISEYLRSNFHITTSGYFSVPPFLNALMVMGADRLLFSVDYPFSENTQGREFLNALPISTYDREKISYRNAVALLGL